MKLKYLAIGFVLLLFSCNRNEGDPRAEITLDSVSFVSHNSAIAYVSIINDPLTAYSGIVISQNPSIEITEPLYSCQTNYNLLGTSDLIPNTDYYARAWISIINSTDGKVTTNFSNEIQFKTKSIIVFTDNRDGQQYPVIEIGNLLWFSENLNYQLPNGCIEIEDNANNCNKFGMLYTNEVAAIAVPEGWRLPTLTEVNSLMAVACNTTEGVQSLFTPKLCITNEAFSTNRLGFSLLFPQIPTSSETTSNTWARFHIAPDGGNDICNFFVTKYGEVGYNPCSSNPLYANIRCVKNKDE